MSERASRRLGGTSLDDRRDEVSWHTIRNSTQSNNNYAQTKQTSLDLGWPSLLIFFVCLFTRVLFTILRGKTKGRKRGEKGGLEGEGEEMDCPPLVVVMTIPIPLLKHGSGIWTWKMDGWDGMRYGAWGGMSMGRILHTHNYPTMCRHRSVYRLCLFAGCRKGSLDMRHGRRRILGLEQSFECISV